MPGCRGRVLEAHHEDGWAHGHDPARCLPLCRAHHKQRHQGWLRLEIVDGEWRFYLEDGTCLGKAGAEHKATDRPQGGSRTPVRLRVQRAEAGVEAQVVPVARSRVAPGERTRASTPSPSAFAAAKAQATQVDAGQPVPGPAAPADRGEVQDADGALVRDAVSALRGLELRRREAEGLVRFALAAEPEREWRLEDLIGEALRAMPTAHLTG